MATEGDDDDLKLVRASAGLLSDLQNALPRLLWKKGQPGKVHSLVRSRDLDHAIQLIEPFQGEPQLLDTSLKAFLPPLVDAYLLFLQIQHPKATPANTLSLDVAASKIIYTFCKVRGYKIITGFLNNEPRYLELILTALERTRSLSRQEDVPWEKSYVLLLWLSHLMLVPFDLSSISAVATTSDELRELHLGHRLPSVAQRVISLGIHYIVSATREQDAAAKLLVRLVTRPDMQRLQLPATIVQWALQSLSSPSPSNSSNLHSLLGPLRLLVGMTAAVDSEDIASLIPTIYLAVKKLMADAMLAFLSSSAVTKKMAIKLFRNVALLSLQSSFVALSDFLEYTSVLEDTIEYCLQSLEDRDTPVRFAASKALSLIILRLDTEFGHQVVQAILDTFQEDMPKSSSEPDFSVANPLRWHGLTLTLAHALFRRSASPQQLPEILNALLLALNFEQRSTIGVSTGSNVRDAACFGIWSLSRRFTTKELLAVDVSSVERRFDQGNSSVIQIMGIQLLLSACLDPSGNIRRGSSAAMQELIGRHPDQVSNGIALVQIVDYHAVGLRRRAMIEVAQSAADLDSMYRKSLLSALRSWRGIGSPDVSSREAAAESTGRLCASQPHGQIQDTVASLQNTLKTYPGTDIEHCHGSMLALSHIIDEKISARTSNTASLPTEDTSHLLSAWDFLNHNNDLCIQQSSRAVRADLPSAVARLISSLAELCLTLKLADFDLVEFHDNLQKTVAVLLSLSEDALVPKIPRMSRALSKLHSTEYLKIPAFDAVVCLTQIGHDSTGMVVHGSGRAIALAAAYPWLEPIYACNRAAVCDRLENIVRDSPLVEWRTVGLQSLSLIIDSDSLHEAATIDVIVRTLDVALNDYTITERGDVGSLVRTKAVQCVQRIWDLGLLESDSEAAKTLEANILRLSMEKMDRVRLQAARCLQRDFDSKKSVSDMDISSFQYFSDLFQPLLHEAPAWKQNAILKGSISCAGNGNESILRTSRSALVYTLQQGSAEMRAGCLLSYIVLLKDTIAQGAESQPLLELIAYLLDTLPNILPLEHTFNWRSLLSLVQKSHFKSNNIPRILAAIEVYRSLVETQSTRADALKKLSSMLKTNPYPKVRITVAENLFLINGDQALKGVDWSKPGQQYDEVRIGRSKTLLVPE